MTGTGNRQRPAERWLALVGAVCLLALAASACSGEGKSAATSTSNDYVAAATAVPGQPSPAELLQSGDFDGAIGAYGALAFSGLDGETRALAALKAATAIRAASPNASTVGFLQAALAAAPEDSPIGPQAAYLLARELTADNDPKGAAKVLKPFVDDKAGGTLAPYLVASYATALDDQDKGDDASGHWDDLLKQDGLPRSLRIQALQSRAAESTKAKDRESFLQQLVKLTSRPADRLMLAQAAQDAGDNQTSAMQLHTVISNDPGTHEAVLTVQALKTAHIALDPGDEALVDYRHEDYAAAEKILESAINAPGISPGQRTFRLYYLAASYESDGKKAQAIAFYDKAASTGATSPFVHRAKYWAAEVMETTGDTKDASARYLELAKDGPAGEFSEEAAFQAGNLLLQAGDAAAAFQVWDSLGTVSYPRVLYWKGVAAERANLPGQAETAFKAAATSGPTDFYGIEAAARLAGHQPDVAYRKRSLSSNIDWDTVTAWLAKAVKPGKAPGHSTAAAQFLNMGLRDDARDALVDPATNATDWQLLGLIREARHDGMADVAATLTSQLTARAKVSDTELPAAVLQLKYPVAYLPVFTQYAQAAGVDPLFLAAIIYQESLWNPLAGSEAGAIGLLQLIASTGMQVGQQIGVGNVTSASLFQPLLNLRLGTAFLGQQLNGFKSPALALAAYNAGPGNAAKWEAAWDGTDAATFLAQVDYSETSSYVENIYEWYAIYQQAYQ